MQMTIRSWLPLIAAAALCALALSWRAGAVASVASAPQTSVAVVNLDHLLKSLTEVEDHKTRLTREAQALDQQFAAQGEQLQRLAEELDELPEDSQAWRDKNLEGIRLQATLNAEIKAQEQWLEGEQARIHKEMVLKAGEAIKTISARDGWDVVLWNHNSNPALGLSAPDGRVETMNRQIVSRTIAYASPRADITQLVIDTMNNAYAVGR